MQRLKPVTSPNGRSSRSVRADAPRLVACALHARGPNVEDAQQRFLEVLVRTQLHGGRGRGEAADPLLALCLGLSLARRASPEDDTADPAGEVFAALEDLLLAVRAELAAGSSCWVEQPRD